MPLPPALIRALFQQVTEKGSRSTILKPLGVALSLSFSATLMAFYLHLPFLLGVLFGTFSALTMALYLFAFTYCLFKDREALQIWQSEPSQRATK